MATFEKLKSVVTGHSASISKMYDSWAENYDKDVVVLEGRGPSLAAKFISSHFSGDREAAVVLDVACGTGLVAREMKPHGFRHFVGIDGSEKMLEVAKETGLYKELKKCLLGEEQLSIQWGSFDVVVIVGALVANHVPLKVIRELFRAAKPGGYVCMTVGLIAQNAAVKAALVEELKKMVEEGLSTCVEVTNVTQWQKYESGSDYIAGDMYLYKKL